MLFPVSVILHGVPPKRSFSQKDAIVNDASCALAGVRPVRWPASETLLRTFPLLALVVPLIMSRPVF